MCHKCDKKGGIVTEDTTAPNGKTERVTKCIFCGHVFSKSQFRLGKYWDTDPNKVRGNGGSHS
jgi:hypothetical protein